ncbi:transposase [Streptacidiphilus sp. 4-A2]|nr:transposase [Streptacidiphilus sp. 4-A2]
MAFQSDRGCQSTSRELTDLAGVLGVRLSVRRTGQCCDNALAESFFATLKRELLGGRPWPTWATAHTAIFEWIEGWYNMCRLQSSLSYRSPAEYETVLAA